MQKYSYYKEKETAIRNPGDNLDFISYNGELWDELPNEPDYSKLLDEEQLIEAMHEKNVNRLNVYTYLVEDLENSEIECLGYEIMI